jgi:hypothetical protein
MCAPVATKLRPTITFTLGEPLALAGNLAAGAAFLRAATVTTTGRKGGR